MGTPFENSTWVFAALKDRPQLTEFEIQMHVEQVYCIPLQFRQIYRILERLHRAGYVLPIQHNAGQPGGELLYELTNPGNQVASNRLHELERIAENVLTARNRRRKSRMASS